MDLHSHVNALPPILVEYNIILLLSVYSPFSDRVGLSVMDIISHGEVISNNSTLVFGT